MERLLITSVWTLQIAAMAGSHCTLLLCSIQFVNFCSIACRAGQILEQVTILGLFQQVIVGWPMVKNEETVWICDVFLILIFVWWNWHATDSGNFYISQNLQIQIQISNCSWNANLAFHNVSAASCYIIWMFLKLLCS